MWCGIKELKEIYHGDWADPEIIYKGISFNEHDIVDEVGNRLEELFKFEHKTIDDLINDGTLTEAVKGKSYEKDSGDIIDNYLCNSSNHESILGDLENLIYCNFESEDYMNTLAERASNMLETDEDIDNDYQCNLISAITTWANENDDRKEAVDEFFNNKDGQDIEDLLYFEYTNNLRDFVDVHEIDMTNLEPYVIYLMNDEYDAGYNLDEIKDLCSKAANQYGDIPFVVVNAKGENVGKGYAVKAGFEGKIKGLTDKEDKEQEHEER